jgi:hypothetical protein
MHFHILLDYYKLNLDIKVFRLFVDVWLWIMLVDEFSMHRMDYLNVHVINIHIYSEHEH